MIRRTSYFPLSVSRARSGTPTTTLLQRPRPSGSATIRLKLSKRDLTTATSLKSLRNEVYTSAAYPAMARQRSQPVDRDSPSRYLALVSGISIRLCECTDRFCVSKNTSSGNNINTLEHTQRIELPALLLNTTQSTDSTPHSSEKQSSKRPAHEKTERPTKQARMSSLTFTQTVEVIVCDTKTKFFIHPSIIAARSPFFDAAVTRWKKAGEPITLADDDPEIFDYDLSLLYAGSFQSLRAEVDDDDVDIASLFKLYILADKLGDLTNANGVIDRLYGVLWESVPTLHKVLPAWRSTPPGSPLRRLLVDAFTRQADPEALSKQLEHASIPKDLVVAIAQRAVGIAGLFVKYSGCRGETAEEAFGKFFAVDDECRYHQHDDLHSYCRAREDAMEDE
ncbi:hypothetical protein LTS02_002463 [Friedmanniomyces endolithicus]|nr:hypothetical protein LTS02_002463 [Friedmanniomyces endolithicus]